MHVQIGVFASRGHARDKKKKKRGVVLGQYLWSLTPFKHAVNQLLCFLPNDLFGKKIVEPASDTLFAAPLFRKSHRARHRWGPPAVPCAPLAQFQEPSKEERKK